MQQKIEQLRSMMRERDIDVIIASGPRNVSYLTGGALDPPWYISDWASSMVLIPAETEALYVGRYDARCPWIKNYSKELYGFPQGGINDTMQFMPQLAEVLKNMHFAKAVIGLEKGGMERQTFPVRPLEKLAQLLPDAQVVSADALLEAIRIPKTAFEIELLREAITINEKALDKAINSVRPGVRYREIWNAYRQSCVENGGLFYLLENPDLGGKGWVDHMAFDLMVESKSLISLDGALTTWRYHEGRRLHYFSDLARCVAPMPASKQLVHTHVEAGILSGILAQTIKIGQAPSKAFGALDKVLKDWRHYQPSLLVHGVGQWVHEQPRFTVPAPMDRFWAFDPEEEILFTYQANSVFQIELNFDLRKIGLPDLHIEDTYVLSESGSKRLSSMPFGIYHNGRCLQE